ncbi:MAG TPA: hypothetical protein VMG99_01325 [Thermoplasmata archaeon]|nr:hypothetical protein [Thermoplasmata archaeon]
MPISRDDFERGRTQDTDEAKVVQLLQAHRGQAYSCVEILEEIGHGSDRPETPSPTGGSPRGAMRKLAVSVHAIEFSVFLDHLVNRGVIEKRMVHVGSSSEWYYSAKL